MKRLILTILFCALTSPAFALVKSVGFMSPTVACTGGDQLMPLDQTTRKTFAPPAIPLSGDWPTGDFTIRHVSLAHWINTGWFRSLFERGTKDAYAVVGHWGPNGDYISPVVVGEGRADISYPVDAAVAFAKDEYFDVHTKCQKGSTHWVEVTIWYAVP